MEYIGTRWAGQHCGTAARLHPYAPSSLGLRVARSIHLQRFSDDVRLRPFTASGSRATEDSADSVRLAQSAVYAGSRLEIWFHDRAATRLAIYGDGLRRIPVAASLASGFGW